MENGDSDDYRIALFHLRLILELSPCHVQVQCKLCKRLFYWYWPRELWPGFALLVGISADHRLRRAVVYGFGFSIHNPPDDNEKEFSLVVISPSGLCAGYVFRNCLGLECRFHRMDHQNDHLKTWWIEDVPPDCPVLLGISFG